MNLRELQLEKTGTVKEYTAEYTVMMGNIFAIVGNMCPRVALKV